MKKTTLFMACCIGLMFFASCKKDHVAPTISILEEAGCVTENAQVYSGEEILVGFTGTGENLTQLDIVISQNGVVLDNHSQSFDNSKNDPVPPYTYKHAFTLEAAGAVTIKGTVTDANGLTASKSFEIYYNVKPNEKFLGHYEGNAIVDGYYDIELSNMPDPMHYALTGQPFPTIIEIEAGEGINDVKATITINDHTSVINGSVSSDDEHKIVFEALNDTYTMNYESNGFTIPIVLDMSYDIAGTLNEGKLELSGNCVGSGEVNMFISSGHLTMEGTVSGSLDKLE